MDSDEKPTITDPKEAAWTASQRTRVLDYLTSERCEHGGVSLEPRWFLSPTSPSGPSDRKQTQTESAGGPSPATSQPTILPARTKTMTLTCCSCLRGFRKSAAAHMANGVGAKPSDRPAGETEGIRTHVAQPRSIP